MLAAPHPDTERIQAGELCADIAPAAGGSLASFFSAGGDTATRHWLRPATDEALAARDPLRMASFPLVPWCNRIRDSQFEFEGRALHVTPNFGTSPHAIHGVGWLRPWRITHRVRECIELQMTHAASADWPFDFSATQVYALDATGLTIFVSIENTGLGRMPAGLGHHPYFPHQRESQGTSVWAEVDKIWNADAETMPTTLSADHPAVSGLRAGLALSEVDLDNNFSGFGHEARISWPDGSGLAMSSQAPLDFFVLYSPRDADIFCMEPVSNCTDWINLRERLGPAAVGGTVLRPGERLHGELRLEPRLA